MTVHDPRSALVTRLARAGCVAAEEEADELLAAGGGDSERLWRLADRRCAGEPLAWVTGLTRFCGLEIAITPGVYVPRWQSEPLARHAVARLGPAGRAIDLGTGAGAIAAVFGHGRPGATVIGTDIDPIAVACARRNGVDARRGSLFEPIPETWCATVDVIVAVLPYVPTDELARLPRDVLASEPRAALDGGPDGTVVVAEAIASATQWLRIGGALVLEVGGEQPDVLAPRLRAAGFELEEVLTDDDGDARGVVAVYLAPSGREVSA